MSEEKNIPIENETTEEIKEETAEASEETAEEAAAEETAETETEPEEKKEETSDNKEESEAEKQLADMNAKYVRLMADFQNQKKRFEKEKADIYQFANEDIVKSLLEVIDNFERALDASQDDGSKFREGMEMIFKQLMGALGKNLTRTSTMP